MDENIFSKNFRNFWNQFSRNQHGLKLTYLYLRAIHNEKTRGDFEKEFLTSVREIAYRSGLVESQVKKHVKALIVLKLVERRVEIKLTKKEDISKYESGSYYKIKPLNDENIKIAMYHEVGANVEYQFNEYRKKKKYLN